MSGSKEHKFKVGDKVVPFPTEDGYLNGHLVAGSTYTVTKIHKNGRVAVDGTFKHDRNGENWDSNWFKPYEEDEAKVENIVTAESLRNSILSLQQERVSLQEKIEQNIAQEKSLTEQLKELGFLLVESKQQPTNVIDEKKAVLYAEDIEEDMIDPCNWKKGDFVQVSSECGSVYCSYGDVFEISGLTKEGWVGVLEDSQGLENYINPILLKFHSRPVVN